MYLRSHSVVAIAGVFGTMALAGARLSLNHKDGLVFALPHLVDNQLLINSFLLFIPRRTSVAKTVMNVAMIITLLYLQANSFLISDVTSSEMTADDISFSYSDCDDGDLDEELFGLDIDLHSSRHFRT